MSHRWLLGYGFGATFCASQGPYLFGLPPLLFFFVHVKLCPVSFEEIVLQYINRWRFEGKGKGGCGDVSLSPLD